MCSFLHQYQNSFSTFAQILQPLVSMAVTEKTTPSATNNAPKTDIVDIIRTLFKWKKWILISCAVAAIGSATIALLLPEYYKSSTTFLAISPDQSTPELLFGDAGVVPELYGNANDIDRLLTIAESNELVDFLVDSFKLYEHYDIKPGSAKAKNSVRKTFRGLYDITKTKRDALSLSIEDKDPQLATMVAEAARRFINERGQKLIKQTQQRALNTFEINIKSKEAQLIVLSDTLQALRTRYGIFNTESQSESLTFRLASKESSLTNALAQITAYKAKGSRYRDSVSIYEVRAAALEQELTQLNTKLNTFNKGISAVNQYTKQYQQANISLSKDKEKLKTYKSTFDADIPALMIVEEASVPLIKSRPFRALIVVASVLIVLVFLLIGILLYEAFQDVDWKSVYEGK